MTNVDVLASISSYCDAMGIGPMTILDMAATHGADPTVILDELRRLHVDRLLANKNAADRQIAESGG